MVTGSFITGAIAGGPIGAAVGLLAGAWLGEKVEKAHEVDSLEQQLTDATGRLSQLKSQLAEAEHESSRYAQAVFEPLQLELSFRTGVAQLPPTG